MVAAHPGEILGEVPTAHEHLHDFRDDRVQEGSVVALVDLRVDCLGVDLQERVEMGVKAAPQGRVFRVAGEADLHRPDHQCRKEGVPSNGTGPCNLNLATQGRVANSAQGTTQPLGWIWASVVPTS